MAHYHCNGQEVTEVNATVYGNQNRVSGQRAIVIGDENNVSGLSANVTGDRNIVTGVSSAVFGDGNTVTGGYATVTGNENFVSGKTAVIVGDGNTVSGEGASVNGDRNTTSGTGVVIRGDDWTVSGPTPTVHGANNIITERDAPALASTRRQQACGPRLIGGRRAVAAGPGGRPARWRPPPLRTPEASDFSPTPRERHPYGVFAREGGERPSSSAPSQRIDGATFTGVAKHRPRVVRMTPTSAVITGGDGVGMRLVFIGNSMSTQLCGIEVPPGTTIDSATSTENGTIVTGADASLLDDLVKTYGDSSSSSSAAAPVKTLREILVGMLDRDRTLDTDSEDRVQCVVCFDRIKCIALDPCGHVETCAECTLALVKDDKVIECPICKEKVNKVAFARV